MKNKLFTGKIKGSIFISVFIAFNMLVSGSVFLQAQSVNLKAPLFVSAQWLDDNISSPEVVVLHISTVRSDYNIGHIPGARYLWPGLIILSSENESTYPADPEKIKKVLEDLGISNDSHVVLCGLYGNLVQVCRVFVTLDNLGLEGRLSILEGGLDEWKASGRLVSLEIPAVRKGKLNLSLKNNFVSGDWVARNLGNNSYMLVDARSKAYYEGTTGTPRPGHIPGAKNLPSTDLFDSKSYHFASQDSLGVLFKSLQIPVGARPVFYCNTGNSASVDFVAALIAGYDPLLFDGSMEEWGSRMELQVVKK
jgi:thiosulfate/3-mercaptopyruvate sulfurtransferase